MTIPSWRSSRCLRRFRRALNRELAYDVAKYLEVAVGTNNLFDKKPEIPELVADYDPANRESFSLSEQYGTIIALYTAGPHGTKGGYYYARLTINFRSALGGRA